MTGNNIKTRYYNHSMVLKNKRYQNETELSMYLWNLTEKEVEHAIMRERLRQSKTYLRRSELRNLCLEEKFEILLSQAKQSIQLNRRYDVSTCRHVSPPTSIIRMEVASSRPDHLPTLSAAKTSKLSILVKSHFCWRSGRFRQ